MPPLLRLASAAQLLLVVPIALVGARRGFRFAVPLAACAWALVFVPIWARGQIGLAEYLSQGTAFATVAVLSGALHQLRRANDGARGTVIPEAVASGDRVEDLLSRRELEVLTMIAEGAPNSEVAVRLFIAETTVQSHVQHILRKLDVRNRTEAVSRYLRD